MAPVAACEREETAAVNRHSVGLMKGLGKYFGGGVDTNTSTFFHLNAWNTLMEKYSQTARVQFIVTRF